MILVEKRTHEDANAVLAILLVQTANLEMIRELVLVVEERNLNARLVRVLSFAIDESNNAVAQTTTSDEVKEIRGNGEIQTCACDMGVAVMLSRYVNMVPFKDLDTVVGEMNLVVVHGNVRGTTGKDVSDLFKDHDR